MVNSSRARDLGIQSRGIDNCRGEEGSPLRAQVSRGVDAVPSTHRAIVVDRRVPHRVRNTTPSRVFRRRQPPDLDLSWLENTGVDGTGDIANDAEDVCSVAELSDTGQGFQYKVGLY